MAQQAETIVQLADVESKRRLTLGVSLSLPPPPPLQLYVAYGAYAQLGKLIAEYGFKTFS